MSRPTDDLVLAYFTGGVFAALGEDYWKEQQDRLNTWTDRREGQVGIIEDAISDAAVIEQAWITHCFELASGCIHGYFEVFEPLGGLWVLSHLYPDWKWSDVADVRELAATWVRTVRTEDRDAMAKAVEAFIQELNKLDCSI